MFFKLLVPVLAVLALSFAAADDKQPVKAASGQVLASGLTQPGAVAIAENGTLYFASQQGGIRVLREGKDQPFGLEDKQIQHLAPWKNGLYACDHHELFHISANGEAKTVVSEQQLAELAKEPITLSSFAIHENGTLFAAANQSNGPGCIFKVTPAGKAALEFAPGQLSELQNISGVAIAGETALIVQRYNNPNGLLLCTQKHRLIATVPFCPGVALDYDNFGRLYGINSKKQQVEVLAKPGAEPQTIPYQFKKLGGLAIDHTRYRILATDTEAGTIVSLPPGDPIHPIDETPLPFMVEPAFPKIKWAGWQPVNEKGVAVPHRPLVLTHANDNSHRTFVATQHGVIHVFPDRPDVEQAKVFLDIQDKVTYNDATVEEGFLGLAFHPKYKENGKFFVFYSPNNGKHPSLETVISRYKVSANDSDKADPNSEEVLFRFKRPFWNHDGGTLCFGPDGYLYIVTGDGGLANDPYDNGQKLSTLLASILRIDVDHRDPGKPYAIPKDNPFVAVANAAPEKFVWGVRNPWRLAFDRLTGQGWFVDVGQNLYEEIDLLEKGANYGWNRREGFHPFGPKAMDINKDMVEPIWEYHHRIGKSMTGGHVYRGKLYPELQGWYLYADYVSAKIWALKYDFEQKRVVANREIANRGLPIMSFGEDEDGESYLMTFSATGQGVDRLVRKK